MGIEGGAAEKPEKTQPETLASARGSQPASASEVSLSQASQEAAGAVDDADELDDVEEGDADLSHDLAPKDPNYPDVLVAYTGTRLTSGLKGGDRIVSVDARTRTAEVTR